MKVCRIFLFFFLLAAGITDGYSAQFFTDARSFQVGGGIDFWSGKYKGDNGRSNHFSFYPVVNFFPINFLLVGPVFQWRIDNGYNSVGLGVNCGFAYGKDIPVVPFGLVSPRFLFDEDARAGFGMDIAGGIMIPIQQHFSINIGPGFWFHKYHDYGWYNEFHMNIDVTGLIF